jgi:hypothetical protein
LYNPLAEKNGNEKLPKEMSIDETRLNSIRRDVTTGVYCKRHGRKKMKGKNNK